MNTKLRRILLASVLVFNTGAFLGAINTDRPFLAFIAVIVMTMATLGLIYD